MRKTLFVVGALLLTLFEPATAAHAAVPKPPTPTGLTAIEPFAYYVAQVSCDPAPKPGQVKLRNLLMNTYRGTYAGLSSVCGTNGNVSEHYEGRAVDWMVSIRNATQYAQAKAFIGWLLATDRAGNRAAMARRLGVQYLIYYNKIWGSWNNRWEPYNNCGATPSPSMDGACHRNHVHISLSWNGGMGATSYWTRHVYPFDYGPCRPRDLNWSGNRTARNSRPCTWYPKVQPARTASAVKKELVKYSGAGVRHGATGPVVTAVQRALRITATGAYNTATVAAVVRFQAAHHLALSGSMNQPTWRALLAVVR